MTNVIIKTMADRIAELEREDRSLREENDRYRQKKECKMIPLRTEPEEAKPGKYLTR